MRKSLGSKRKELSDEHIAEITRIFGGVLWRPAKMALPSAAFSRMRISATRWMVGPRRRQSRLRERRQLSMPRPLLNRLLHLTLEPDLGEWCIWAGKAE